jgi:hypothetical protein
MERTITLRLIEDFSSDVVISSRIKDQLVKLVRNDRFTQDYIDAVLTQSSDILHILLRDISVLQQCLGNLSIWSVTVPQIKEPSEGIREAPLNSLIEYQARLCEVLKIEAPDLDRFLTRQPTADSVDLVTPTFSFPDYLIMSIYFGVSGGKSWLFQRLYAELKSEKLFSSSPLSTPKSDAEVIGITIDQFKLLMETLRDEFRELFSSTDFNFRQLERFWIATREESGAQEEDEKTIENATSRKKMQRFSSFHSVVFADQICLIAQCKVFGYEDVSNDAALQATIQAMLRAKHLRHILQVMQTCSSFLQQIHCSMKAEKIMIDSRRETDIDLLKKFCLSKLATFSSIKVVEVPFILDYIFRIASPLDPESSSHLLFLQKICSNIAIGVFLVSKGCNSRGGYEKFRQSINEAMTSCRNRGEEAHTDLLASFLVVSQLYLPFIDETKTLYEIFLSVKEVPLRIIDELVNIHFDNLSSPENIELVKMLYRRLGNNTLDNAIDTILHILSDPSVIKITFPDFLISTDCSLEIETQTVSRKGSVQAVQYSQEKLLEVERVVAFAFPDTNDSESFSRFIDDALSTHAQSSSEHSDSENVSSDESRGIDAGSTLEFKESRRKSFSSQVDPIESTKKKKKFILSVSRSSLLRFFSNLWELLHSLLAIHREGHPGYQQPVISFNLSEVKLGELVLWQQDLIHQLSKELTDWEDFLSQFRRRSSFIRFLSVKQILRLRTILLSFEVLVQKYIPRARWTEEDLSEEEKASFMQLFQPIIEHPDSVHQIGSMIEALKKVDFSNLKRNPTCSSGTVSSDFIRSLDETVGKDPQTGELVDNFLSEIELFFTNAFSVSALSTAYLSRDPMLSEETEIISKPETVPSPSIRQLIIDAENYTPHGLVHFVLNLFETFPSPNQVLWCSSDTTSEDVSLFLARSLVFPDRYCLLEFNLLSVEVQSALVDLQYELHSFAVRIKDRPIQCEILYVQSGKSFISSTTWMAKLLPKKVLKRSSRFPRLNEYSPLKRRVSEMISKKPHHLYFRCLTFCGRRGDGKTTRILKLLESKGLPYQIIHIHRYSRDIHIIKKLLEAQSTDCRRVIFQVSGYACSNALNRIWFSLFILGRLSDSKTGEFFTLFDLKNWKFYIEVPSYRDKPELYNLSSCSESESESEEYLPDWSIDEKCIEFMHFCVKTFPDSDADLDVDTMREISRIRNLCQNGSLWNAMKETYRSEYFWAQYLCEHLDLSVLFLVSDLKIQDPEVFNIFSEPSEKLVCLFLNGYNSRRDQSESSRKLSSRLTELAKRKHDRLQFQTLFTKAKAIKRIVPNHEWRFTDAFMRTAHSQMTRIMEIAGIHPAAYNQKVLQKIFIRFLSQRLQMFPNAITEEDTRAGFNDFIISQSDFELLTLLFHEAVAHVKRFSKNLIETIEFAIHGYFASSQPLISEKFTNELHSTPKWISESEPLPIPQLLESSCTLIFETIPEIDSCSNSVCGIKLFRLLEDVVLLSESRELLLKLQIKVEDLDSEPSRLDEMIQILSMSFDVHLHEVRRIISEREYILTPQYVFKMLQIQERMFCGLPAIVVGETGV